MFQGGGVPRWGNNFVLACGNFLVSLSIRWGFDDDDDDRGGLGFYAGQLALEGAIGGAGAAGGTAKRAGTRNRAPTTPETDTGDAARALTTHTDLLPLRDNPRHG